MQKLNSPEPTALATQPVSIDPKPVRIKISAIQGAQHRSPMDGQIVSGVEGIVTALKERGFYMQDPEPDDDESSSDAIFVKMLGYTNVKVGDLVRVDNALVREVNPAGVGSNSLTITTLESRNIKVIQEGLPLPEPVVLGVNGRWIPNKIICDDVQGYIGRNDGEFDPENDGIDFFESLESMRVQINNAIAVNSTNSYRELAVVADNGQNAGIFASSGAIVLRENDSNPERIILNDSLLNIPYLRVGTKFTTPILCIIEYSFGNYKCSPTQKLIYSEAAPLEIPQLPERKSGTLSIASYNLENLNPSLYPEQHRKIAEQIVGVMDSPDILALQEILDDDGVLDSGETSADENISFLIKEIQDLGGPAYRVMTVDPINNSDGGVRGGNIRSVILYRSDTGLAPMPGVPGTALDDPELRDANQTQMFNLNPARIGNQLSAFRASRKPVLAGFVYKGEPVIVITVHLKSKYEDGPLFGDQQPPPEPTAIQRQGQTQAIADFSAAVLNAYPNTNLVVAGDFNDFPWAKSLEPLYKAGLYNLAQKLEENERYTYNYEGNAQMLDHIWVSPAIADKLLYFRPLTINSLEIATEQISDHDPVIAHFNFDKPE